MTYILILWMTIAPVCWLPIQEMLVRGKYQYLGSIWKGYYYKVENNVF